MALDGFVLPDGSNSSRSCEGRYDQGGLGLWPSARGCAVYTHCNRKPGRWCPIIRNEAGEHRRQAFTLVKLISGRRSAGKQNKALGERWAEERPKSRCDVATAALAFSLQPRPQRASDAHHPCPRPPLISLPLPLPLPPPSSVVGRRPLPAPACSSLSTPRTHATAAHDTISPCALASPGRSTRRAAPYPSARPTPVDSCLARSLSTGPRFSLVAAVKSP